MNWRGSLGIVNLTLEAAVGDGKERLWVQTGVISKTGDIN